MVSPDDNPRPTAVEEAVDREPEEERDWFAIAQELCHEPFEALTDR